MTAPPASDSSPSRQPARLRALSVQERPEHLIRIVYGGQEVSFVGREVQPFRSVQSHLREVFPPRSVAVILATALALICLDLWCQPKFIHNGIEKPHWGAYMTIMGVFVCITLFTNGGKPEFLWPALVAVLGVAGLIDKKTVFAGFARDGPWIPQLLLVIIGATQDSGLLEHTLSVLLGSKPVGWCAGPCMRVRTFCVVAILAALIGLGPAVSIATPMISRVAQRYGIPRKPLLLVVLFGASCGNVLLLTSSFISVAIKEIISPNQTNVAQTPEAMALTVVLGLYAVLLAPRWAESGNDQETSQNSEVEHRACEPDPVLSTASGSPVLEFSGQKSAVLSELASELDLQYDPDLRYLADFVVQAGSIVIGRTPRTAGILLEQGVQLHAISRSGFSRRHRASVMLPSQSLQDVLLGTQDMRVEAPTEWQSQALRPEEIEAWHFMAGDIMTIQCSAAGFVALRKNPGVFMLRGLHCHYLLGGRRHERRLFECVVAAGSQVVGKTLEELLGLVAVRHGSADSIDQAQSSRLERQISNVSRSRHRPVQLSKLEEAPCFVQDHRGYPLAGWRQKSTGEGQPLSLSQDRIEPGDVLLIDAFESFPELPMTGLNFLVTALVPNSEAPRHGRQLDEMRGAVALLALLISVIVADLNQLPLVFSSLLAVVILCATSAVKASNVVQFLNLPLLITIGAGMTISEAIQETGVAYALATLLQQLGLASQSHWAVLCAVSVTAQLLANALSSVVAGLILAPVVVEVAKRDPQLAAASLTNLLIISCNIALSTNFSSPAAAAVGRAAGFRQRDFLWFGLPAQAITLAFVVGWARLFPLEVIHA